MQFLDRIDRGIDRKLSNSLLLDKRRCACVPRRRVRVSMRLTLLSSLLSSFAQLLNDARAGRSPPFERSPGLDPFRLARLWPTYFCLGGAASPTPPSRTSSRDQPDACASALPLLYCSCDLLPLTLLPFLCFLPTHVVVPTHALPRAASQCPPHPP